MLSINHLYRHICYVDLKRYKFVWERAYRDAITAFQDACLRYARRLQILYNRRRYTNIDSATKDAYTRFEAFMTIDFPDGTAHFSDKFTAEVGKAHALAQSQQPNQQP